MKSLIICGSFLLTLTFGCAHQPNQHNHHHAHHKSNPDKNDQRLKLNDGKKWKTDEVMRNNMDAIHTGLVELIASKASQKDYADFHKLVSSHTETIITNCKMSPEMDEAYHVILEKMLDANEEIKNRDLQKGAIKKFIGAFMDYQKYFDHSLKH